MADKIRVRYAREDDRVALWERDQNHPGGEVFIGPGEEVVEVAGTPAVLKAIADGNLVRVDAPHAAQRAVAAPEESGETKHVRR